VNTTLLGGCSYLLYCFVLFFIIWILSAIAFGYPIVILTKSIRVPDPFGEVIFFGLTFLSAIPATSLADRLIRKLFVPRSRTPIAGQSVAEPPKDTPFE